MLMVSMLKSFAVLSLLSICGTTAFAQQRWTSSRPDGHAPIGVMGDHTHEKGELMLSYRWMYMDMSGNRVGTDSVSDSSVVSPSGYNFLITPTQMPMQMHMFGAMYAVSNRLTLMGMTSLLSSTMDLKTRPGGAFSSQSTGMGDTQLTGLLVLADGHRQKIHANLGISLPTGSITQQGVTPMSAPNRTRLPYPMQLGSGTVDLLPGITYLAQSDNWSGGGQVRATLRTGTNSASYRLGNQLMATGWLSRKLNDWVSASFRVTSNNWGNIHGADPSFAGAVMMRMVPTAFPNLRGGNRVDIGGGINTYIRRIRPGQLRLAVEVSHPVYQRLDGPQLQTGWQAVIGTQFLF